MRPVILLVVALSSIAGCQSAPHYITHDPIHTTIGRSVESRPIEYFVLGENTPNVPGETILFIATIHGNESAGTPLLHQLSDHLRANPHLLQNRTIIFLPVANPDGLAHHRRRNSQGIDLNRDFPARNHGASTKPDAPTLSPLSAPESRAIWRLIHRYPPDRVVSIHQPVNCIDYDGPARSLAQHMAAAGPLPVRKLGARSGSLGAYMGVDLQTPIITLELPRSADALDPSALWNRFGQTLLAAITFDNHSHAQHVTAN